MHKFVSRRDTWLKVVVWCSAVAICVAGVAALRRSSEILGGVLFLAIAFELWVFYGTYYVVSDTTLVVRSGPFSWRIELSSITAVMPSADAVASPASSLDRLEIQYGSGGRLLVSPAEKDAFMAALRLSPSALNGRGHR